MRTRIFSAILLAAVTIIALPGTALMASITYPMGTDAGGAVIENLHYDDQSLLITDLTILNNANKGRITVSCFQRGTENLVFGPKTYTAKSGSTVEDLSARNIHMVHETGTSKYGPYDVIVPPVDCTFGWQGQ